MAWPHTFGGLTSVPLSYLDDNFTAAAFAADVAALTATVAALPASTAPLPPASAAAIGVSATLARADHVHRAQGAVINTQTGATYTVQLSDWGKVIELDNTGAITVTVANSLPVEFNCTFTQANTGQVTLVAQAGGAQRQRQGFTKTAGRWAEVSLYVRANAGGSAAEYVLAGDMVA